MEVFLKMSSLVLLAVLVQVIFSLVLNENLFLNLEKDNSWKKQAVCLAKAEAFATRFDELGRSSTVRQGQTIAYFSYNLTSPAYEILEEYIRVRVNLEFGTLDNGIRTHRIGGRMKLPKQHFPGQTDKTVSVIFVIIDTTTRFKMIMRKYIDDWLQTNSELTIMILYNNLLDKEDNTKASVIAQRTLKYIHGQNGIFRTLFFYATKKNLYEVYVLKRYNEECRKVVSVKLGDCTDGEFSFPLRDITKAMNPTAGPNCSMLMCARYLEPYVQNKCQEGVEIELVKIIKEKIPVKWKDACLNDPRGELQDSGKWTGFLGFALKNSCDLIIGGLYPDNEVHDYFAGTSAYFMEDYAWFVEVAEETPAWQGMFHVFSPKLTIAIFCVIVVSSLLRYTFGYHPAAERSPEDYSSSLLNTFGVVINAAVDQPKIFSQRIFYLTLVLFAFIVSVSYTSKLIMVFTNPGRQSQVLTIQEVIDAKIPFGGSSDQRDWFNNDEEKVIYEKFNTSKEFESKASCLESVAQGKKVLLINARLALAYPNRDAIFQLPKRVFGSPLELITTQYSAFAANFSHILIRLTDSGITQKILNDYEFKQMHLSQLNQVDKEEESSPVVLSLKHTSAAFSVLIMGLSISFFVFTCETERVRYMEEDERINRANEIKKRRDERRNVSAFKVSHRCSLQLQESIPLVIKITSHPQAIVRRLFYNETKLPFSISIVNMTKHLKLQKDNVVIPCATNGRYDLILTAKRHSFVHIDVLGRHPSWNWKLLNETNPIRVRFQNRMQKKQMIIKWSRSKLDIHAMHYCIIINTKAPQKNFCSALQDSLSSNKVKDKRNCMAPIDSVWLKQKEKIIDPYATNVICTGSKPNQIIKGLVPNLKYFVDIYGVHTKKQNLTILLKSASAWFNRTHPGTIRDNMLTMGKIAGGKREREAIFSYKIPFSSTQKGKTRFLILPCSGSQIDVKILKRRLRIRTEMDIYKPTYVSVPEANPGDRLILRVKPSNVDEFLHANKVGIAVSMSGQFKYYPELPSNTSLFLSGSYRNCEPKIAWYPSQDERRIRYCVIIFRLPNNSRSSVDETNYCLDFGKNVMDHPQFYERNCYIAYRGAQIEQNSLLNLIPGDSYLVYVTLHLIGHNYLPYESLKVNIHPHCRNNTDDVLVRAFSHYDK